MAHTADLYMVAANLMNPKRVAQCSCGEVHKGTLNEINAWFDRHKVEGTEGCDHAIWIECAVLDDKEHH